MAANLIGMTFLPYYNHFMSILDTNTELKKTARGVFKQVAWAAGGTALGGVFGGPLGAMVGGMAGSVLGYRFSSDYDSLVTVLKELTDEEKKNLVKKIQELVGCTSLEALTSFIGGQAQREVLLQMLRAFVDDLKLGG